MESLLGKVISTEEIIFLSFRHADKKKVKVAVWTAISSLNFIFKKPDASCDDMLRVLKEELYYHELLERGFVRKRYISDLLEILENWEI